MGHYQSGAEIDVTRWRDRVLCSLWVVEVHLGTSWRRGGMGRPFHTECGEQVGWQPGAHCQAPRGYRLEGLLRLHLCLSRPCVDAEPVVVFHVTRVRSTRSKSASKYKRPSSKRPKALAGTGAAPRKRPAARNPPKKLPLAVVRDCQPICRAPLRRD